MTEERTQYTVSGLLIENELLRERVEALRKTADGFTDASSFQWSQYQRRIKELEATVERLEADNCRLRKLDSIPLDALKRQFLYSSPQDSIDCGNYDAAQADADMQDVGNWLFPQDGDA